MDLSLLPLDFSLILTVASRFLHPYSTDDKTSRLMVKRFSTVRDTLRGSQSYMEKRRGRREIEVTRRRRGGIKSGESHLASKQFPMCSPQSGTSREVHGVTRRKKRGRREIEVTRRQRGGVKRGETNLASNQFPTFLHSLEHPERFTELRREEKGEGGDRGKLGEKRESQKGREQSSQ